MTQTYTIFELIARKHLGIVTLQTRNSDRLDFRSVPVWGLKAALEEAFRAGVESARVRPISLRRDSELWPDTGDTHGN